MEKITELSKPVAWVLHTRGGDVPTLDECYVANAEGMENIHSSPLYSQEYVSALLQRIASQDDHINQQQDRIESLEKKNGDLGKALGAAEKRLVHIKDACDTWERKAISNFEECATMSQRIEELEQAMRHIHGAALDITVPRTAIAKAAEFAAEHAAMKEQRNG